MGVPALALALSVTIACGGESEPWATEADAVVAAMAEAYGIADAYQTARFYSAGGSLDLETWVLGVATTPEQVVEVVERLWFFRGPEGIRVSVVPEHVFLSPDGALVWWYGFDTGGIEDWVQSYVFSSGGRDRVPPLRRACGAVRRDHSGRRQGAGALRSLFGGVERQ